VRVCLFYLHLQTLSNTWKWYLTLVRWSFSARVVDYFSEKNLGLLLFFIEFYFFSVVGLWWQSDTGAFAAAVTNDDVA
jgi:hypothetical protein